MSCTHTNSCPLHPKLNASLGGWKTSYCDTEQAWSDCARYQMSVAGKPVPLALLPNGKVLGILADKPESKPTPVLVAHEGGGGVAVMTDVQAEVALAEAAQSTGGFFRRFRKLFGGPK